MKRTSHEETTSSKTTGDSLAGDDWFLVVETDDAGSLVPLKRGGVYLLGRDGECDIVVQHRSVSRNHARLHVDDALTLGVEDLGSRNGTSIRGTAIAKGSRARLASGDSAVLGSVSIFVNRRDRARGQSPLDPDRVVLDPQVLRLYSMLDAVAASPLNMLVFGETGTGKDGFASEAHRRSGRAQRPLVGINCAALPESLLEAELFGFERGAFTGATGAKIGLLEAADGGSLLLDEIGDMPLSLQAKLLRVIENGEIRRLGGVKSRTVDIRYIATTHRDLRAMCDLGQFRLDLFFRLHGVAITLPPLRQRPIEVLPLAEAFARAMARTAGKPIPNITVEAKRLLQERSWPGNVRELRNTIERAVFLCGGGDIEAKHVAEVPQLTAPLSFRAPTESIESPSSTRTSPPPSLADEVGEIEKVRILEALATCAGNQSAAAKLLGVTRATLIGRMNKYGMLRPRKLPQ